MKKSEYKTKVFIFLCNSCAFCTTLIEVNHQLIQTAELYETISGRLGLQFVCHCGFSPQKDQVITAICTKKLI